MPQQSITGTGIYGNALIHRDDPDNVPELTAEQVKLAYEEAARADRDTQDRAANQQTGDAFVAGHPEYVDNQANASLMQHEMNTMFGEGLHTLEHFEMAYASLRKTNFLSLDRTVLAAQAKQSAKQRYATESARIAGPTEEEMYAMPLEDIRIAHAQENQRRMQRRGEEGGW